MVNCNLNKDYKAEADINELSAYMENGYELVDVRDELSYAYGNIKGSVNLSKDALCEHADDYAGRKLLLYCKRGEASLEAAEVLREHGADAVSLRGGYLAWLMADMFLIPTYFYACRKLRRQMGYPVKGKVSKAGA